MRAQSGLRRVRNTAGSVFIMVLVMTAVISVSFYFLIQEFVRTQEVMKNRDTSLDYRVAIHSTLDYVIYGIKKRWCFSPSLLPVETSQCGLDHPASVPRVIMSMEEENLIRDMIDQGLYTAPTSGSISQKEFEIKVASGDLGSQHPLYKIFSRIERDIASITIKVSRDDSPYLPRPGREVYLNVSVTLDPRDNGMFFRLNRMQLQATSVMSIHPREVATFALLVPRDLVLDQVFNAPVEAGDTVLHQFSSKGPEANTGLMFMSPVFVNRNIRLPQRATPIENSPYAAVTFGDRVVLGDGWVMENGKGYASIGAGGASQRYWSQNPTFGGFLRGVENDGEKDLGLDYFAKLQLGTPVDQELMRSCIRRSLARSDMNMIRASQLYGNRTFQNGPAATYRVGLNNLNNFSPQELAFLQPVQQNSGTATRSGTGKPLLSLSIDGAGIDVSAEMAMSTTLIAYPDVGTAQLPGMNNQLDAAKKNLTQASGDLQGYKDKLKDAQDDRTQAQTDLAKAQADLAALQADPNAPAGAVNAKKKQIDDLNDRIAKDTQDIAQWNDKIQQANADLSALNQTIANLNSAITNISNRAANPPRITVDVRPVMVNGRAEPDRLDISVDVVNPGSMVDANGRPGLPRIGVSAYDNSFDKGRFIGSGSPSPSITGYITYSLSGGQWVPAAKISRTADGNSPVNLTEPTQAPENDLAALDVACANQHGDGGSGAAFGGASWSQSFASSTRTSWNFSRNGGASTDHSDPLTDEVVFDQLNSKLGTSTLAFQLWSIAGKCRVKESADFLVGFLACDEFIIEARSKPLRIIGTVITSKLNISPTAFTAGIRWSSIYHPQSTIDLRNAKILHPYGSVNGTCVGRTTPIWHPMPGIKETADSFACNAISLRAKANPFQWTSIDPDCGLLPGNSNTTCKKELHRFIVVEHSRESNL